MHKHHGCIRYCNEQFARIFWVENYRNEIVQGNGIMMDNFRKIKKVLWLEDQYEDWSACIGSLFVINVLVDPVKSTSDAMRKLLREKFDVYIVDLKVLPGDDPVWQELDEMKRKENPSFDPYLGIEFLRFLDEEKKMNSELWRKIKFDFNKVIVFSVVNEKKIRTKLISLGIPDSQIVPKSSSDLNTLRELIMKIIK